MEENLAWKELRHTVIIHCKIKLRNMLSISICRMTFHDPLHLNHVQPFQEDGSKFHHRLNDLGGRTEPALEFLDQIVKSASMGDVRIYINAAFRDPLHHILEIIPRCVTAAHQRQFPLMEFGIPK